MAICEFCLSYTREATCAIGLDIRKGMTCREFRPGIEKFCSDPKDFVSPEQIVQMATYFGIGRTELKKVRLMATQEGNRR